MPTIPTIVFGILLSTLLGAIYHLLRGGSTKMMLIFIAIAWVGFWLGDGFAWYMEWYFLGIGNLNAGTGVISCVLFLILGDVIRTISNRMKAG